MKQIDKIKTLRFEFSTSLLNDKHLSSSPLKLFEQWMDHALRKKVSEPNAMTLATSMKSGMVDARIVLLRDFTSKGFTFFSNYNSIKGQEIRQNKNVCLNFFWSEIHRQVRIRGTVVKLSSQISDAYFAKRPRESQLAAWASQQSEKLSGRNELMNRYEFYAEKFLGEKVPRPNHWGGYLVKPTYFEFWQGQTNRLHDRIAYVKKKNGWQRFRINP